MQHQTQPRQRHKRLPLSRRHRIPLRDNQLVSLTKSSHALNSRRRLRQPQAKPESTLHQLPRPITQSKFRRYYQDHNRLHLRSSQQKPPPLRQPNKQQTMPLRPIQNHQHPRNLHLLQAAQPRDSLRASHQKSRPLSHSVRLSSPQTSKHTQKYRPIKIPHRRASLSLRRNTNHEPMPHNTQHMLQPTQQLSAQHILPRIINTMPKHQKRPTRRATKIQILQTRLQSTLHIQRMQPIIHPKIRYQHSKRHKLYRLPQKLRLPLTNS